MLLRRFRFLARYGFVGWSAGAGCGLPGFASYSLGFWWLGFDRRPRIVLGACLRCWFRYGLGGWLRSRRGGSRLPGPAAGGYRFGGNFAHLFLNLVFWLGWLFSRRWLGFHLLTPRRICPRMHIASARECTGISGQKPENCEIRSDFGRTNRHLPAPDQTRHCSMPCKKMSLGKSIPINTILFSRFSPACHCGPRSLPINWWTPWKITLRSVPCMWRTPL